jgi:uncharacterized surface protein with fasciclin (FAS1) repeats
VARTEFGVAIGSILIVAGVLAIPIIYPAPVAPLALPHISPRATPSADLVGTGCAAYSASEPKGAGSIVGMSQSLVTEAASHNPILKSLTAAVSGNLNPKVNLVSTLNASQFTVFAPVDSAFAKLPAATLASLKLPANAATLTSILKYHVVAGERLPANIDGTLTTVEGGTITVAGSGDNITVNGASVVCGGIQTANATVYLIDTVLTPPAK